MVASIRKVDIPGRRLSFGGFLSSSSRGDAAATMTKLQENFEAVEELIHSWYGLVAAGRVCVLLAAGICPRLVAAPHGAAADVVRRSHLEERKPEFDALFERFLDLQQRMEETQSKLSEVRRVRCGWADVSGPMCRVRCGSS